LWCRIGCRAGLGVMPFFWRVLGDSTLVQGFRSGAQDFGFRVLGFGFQIEGFGIKVSGVGFRVWGSGFRVQGLWVGVWG